MGGLAVLARATVHAYGTSGRAVLVPKTDRDRHLPASRGSGAQRSTLVMCDTGAAKGRKVRWCLRLLQRTPLGEAFLVKGVG